MKLAPITQIETHALKSLFQNHTERNPKSNFIVLAHIKLLDENKIAICPSLTPALLLGPVMHLIWYNEEFYIQSYGGFYFKKIKGILLLTFVGVQGCLGEDSHSEPQI